MLHALSVLFALDIGVTSGSIARLRLARSECTPNVRSVRDYPSLSPSTLAGCCVRCLLPPASAQVLSKNTHRPFSLLFTRSDQRRVALEHRREGLLTVMIYISPSAKHDSAVSGYLTGRGTLRSRKRALRTMNNDTTRIGLVWALV